MAGVQPVQVKRRSRTAVLLGGYYLCELRDAAARCLTVSPASMQATLRYALAALAITMASSYAPAGPDNLSAREEKAVQTRLDQFLSIFAPGNDKELCQAWVDDAFTSSGDVQFNHPPPIGSVKGHAALFNFCETVRNISKVQEWRQDGSYTWVATDSNHTRLDVLLPALYINDAPFAKTMQLLFRMRKEHGAGDFKIQEGSEMLTTTQSNFTFPAN